MNNLDLYGFNKEERQEVPVLITTDRRAFAGLADLRLFDKDSRSIFNVTAMRNALDWGVSEGVEQLAVDGPGVAGDHKLSTQADAWVVTDVKAIRILSVAARERWGL